jgi:chorismate dehydratase
MSSIATVALDSSSRTSAALIKVLFARHWDRKVEFAEADPNLEAMLAASDAALLIGDPALSVDRSQFHTWDLGEEWRRFTGKPFVFAFWAVRGGAAEAPSLAHVARVFQLSQVEGLNHLDSISHEWATKLKLGESVVRAYLTRNIDYSLDAENVAGMELFFRHAAEVGALPASPRLRFLESGRSALTR